MLTEADALDLIAILDGVIATLLNVVALVHRLGTIPETSTPAPWNNADVSGW
jgi:hypothetical protein